MIVILFLCNSNQHSLLLLSSCLFQRRSNGHRGAALRQGMRRAANATRSAIVSDGTGPAHFSSVSDTFTAFTLLLHRVTRIGQNGTGQSRHGQLQQRDQHWRHQQRGKDNRYACCYFFHCFSTFIFSSSYSSSFPVIYFPTNTTTGGARKERAGRTGRDIRGRR